MGDNKNTLSELIKQFAEKNDEKTAMVVDQKMFRNAYRAMVRIASTNNWHLYLVELDLKAKESVKLSSYADHLVELSASLLRCCDVIYKYSDSQIILLLMVKEKDDYLVPLHRVLYAHLKEGNVGVKVTFTQEEVANK